MKHKKFDEIYPYVYQITEIKTGMKYFGVRWINVRDKVIPKKDIGIKYFTSSKNLKFKNSFKKKPKDFLVEIIYTFDTPEEAITYEHKFNKKIIKRDDYYNQQAYPAIINSREMIDYLTELKKNRKLSYSHKKNISKSLKGRIVTI